MTKIILDIACDGEFCADCDLHFMKPRRCMGFGKPLEVSITKSRGVQILRLPECLAAENAAKRLEDVMRNGKNCGNCCYRTADDKVCMNADSPQSGSPMLWQDVCDFWED